MSALRHGSTVAAAVACIGVLSACGEDAQTLERAAASPLHERVDTVRAELQSKDTRGARAELTEFRADVQRLADAGGINLEDARVLVAYAESIEGAIPQPATDTVTPRLPTPSQLGDATTSVPPGAGAPAATIRPTRPVPPAPVTQTPTLRPAPEPSDDPELETPEPEEPEDSEPEDQDPSDGDTDSGASDG